MRAIGMTVIGVGLLAARVSAAEPAPKTQQERASYAMGAAVAKRLQAQGVQVDVDVYVRGLRDGLGGGKLALSEEELRTAMRSMLADVRAKQTPLGKDRKAAGAAFLAANEKKQGVVTLPSGLQYQVLEAGRGPRPSEGDTVDCVYRGTFVDGREFDSSRKHATSSGLTVARLIPGFREALLLMPVGSRWQVWMPPALGYGTRGAGRKGKVARNETLAFEIQLLGIRPRGSASSEKTASLRPAPEE